jgi:DNA-binding transcriptional ArsR family regulator
MPVGELAGRLPVSRPAVSQHLKILKEAGLVEEFRTGTRHVYSVKGEGVQALRDYVESIWSVALERLAAAAEASAPKDEDN